MDSTLQKLVEQNKIITTKTEYGLFNVLKNDFIGRWMMNIEHFEKDLVQVLLPYLKKGDHVIDVGANIGCFTVPFAKAVGCDGCVYSFEPQNVIFQILKSNIEMNFTQEPIQLYRASVGHRSQISQMSNSNDDGTPLNYLKDQISNFGGLSLGKDGEQVPMISLDDIFLKNSAPIRMIKIDVEGAERLVVYGARQLISRDKPVIFFEKNKKKITQSMIDFFELKEEVIDFNIVLFLKNIGYTQFSWHKENILAVFQ